MIMWGKFPKIFALNVLGVLIYGTAGVMVRCLLQYMIMQCVRPFVVVCLGMIIRALLLPANYTYVSLMVALV